MATAKRRAKALELKLAGLTLQQIADQLEYADRQSAGKDLDRAFAQSIMERNHNADLLLEEQLGILNRMRRSVWPAAIQGDPRAVEVVLKIVDRTTKLLRLDPTLNVTLELSTVDAIERQISTLTQQLALEGTDYAWSDADEPGTVQEITPGRAVQAP